MSGKLSLSLVINVVIVIFKSQGLLICIATYESPRRIIQFKSRHFRCNATGLNKYRSNVYIVLVKVSIRHYVM